MAKAYYLTDEERKLLQHFFTKQRQQLASWKPNADPMMEEHQEFLAPEVYIARTPNAGIPAMYEGQLTGTGTLAPTDDVPAYATCQIWKVSYPNLIKVTDLTRKVYNLFTEDIPGDSWILVARDKFGTWVATAPAPSSSSKILGYRYFCDGESPINRQVEYAYYEDGHFQFIRYTGVCCDCVDYPTVSTGTGSGTFDPGTGTGTLDDSYDTLCCQEVPTQLCMTFSGYTGECACWNGRVVNLTRPYYDELGNLIDKWHGEITQCESGPGHGALVTEFDLQCGSGGHPLPVIYSYCPGSTIALNWLLTTSLPGGGGGPSFCCSGSYTCDPFHLTFRTSTQGYGPWVSMNCGSNQPNAFITITEGPCTPVEGGAGVCQYRNDGDETVSSWTLLSDGCDGACLPGPAGIPALPLLGVPAGTILCTDCAGNNQVDCSGGSVDAGGDCDDVPATLYGSGAFGNLTFIWQSGLTWVSGDGDWTLTGGSSAGSWSLTHATYGEQVQLNSNGCADPIHFVFFYPSYGYVIIDEQ